WQAGRNQRQYAVFSATVIAAASDQDSDFHNKAKHKLISSGDGYIVISDHRNVGQLVLGFIVKIAVLI
ncbi:hypothetical protein, partial [Aeromonas caviae]|uniref:hypothetical protein n=1 Tax=Aeromonas caviae TaxID=648 RepID=UPI001CC666C5